VKLYFDAFIVIKGSNKEHALLSSSHISSRTENAIYVLGSDIIIE
jgi:hypothetical protein